MTLRWSRAVIENHCSYKHDAPDGAEGDRLVPAECSRPICSFWTSRDLQKNAGRQFPIWCQQRSAREWDRLSDCFLAQTPAAPTLERDSFIPRQTVNEMTES